MDAISRVFNPCFAVDEGFIIDAASARERHVGAVGLGGCDTFVGVWVASF